VSTPVTSTQSSTGVPVGVVDEDLRDVRRHGRDVRAQRQQRIRRLQLLQGAHVPPHALGAWLAAGDVDGCAGRVDADDLDAAVGEHQRERTGAAADVEHRARAELVDRDGRIDLEVAAIGVERVVDRREPRMREDRVGHAHSPGCR
jgi:hypothetical protein